MIETNLPTASLPQLLNVKQVADLLGISTRSVWRLCSAKELIAPLHIGRGRIVRWRLSDIQTYIDGQSGGQNE